MRLDGEPARSERQPVRSKPQPAHRGAERSPPQGIGACTPYSENPGMPRKPPTHPRPAQAGLHDPHAQVRHQTAQVQVPIAQVRSQTAQVRDPIAQVHTQTAQVSPHPLIRSIPPVHLAKNCRARASSHSTHPPVSINTPPKPPSDEDAGERRSGGTGHFTREPNPGKPIPCKPTPPPIGRMRPPNSKAVIPVRLANPTMA